MDNIFNKILDEDNIVEYKIIKRKNTKIIIKLKSGTGLFKVYPKKSNLNKSKLKIYRKCLEMLKVNVVIISNNKIKIRKLNRLLYSALCYIQKKKIYTEKSNKNNKPISKLSFFIKEMIVVFSFVGLILIIFIADYSTIKNKINRENQVKLNEIEGLFKINNCESKGHLQALKVTCQDWKNSIELLKNVIKLFNI